MAEVGRFLAFLLTCSVIGLLMLAVLKVAARLVHDARRGLRSWQDLRVLRAYEAELSANLDDQQTRRGDA